MPTLEEMAAKGYNKATAKSANISRAWEAAKSRMIEGYRATPFGPTRKANYEAAVRAATHRQDWEKWRRNWTAKMSE
ncbi:MAG: hypothetical protein QXP81_09355 [Nitrososphaerota archaeon]